MMAGSGMTIQGIAGEAGENQTGEGMIAGGRMTVQGETGDGQAGEGMMAGGRMPVQEKGGEAGENQAGEGMMPGRRMPVQKVAGDTGEGQTEEGHKGKSRVELRHVHLGEISISKGVCSCTGGYRTARSLGDPTAIEARH